MKFDRKKTLIIISTTSVLIVVTVVLGVYVIINGLGDLISGSYLSW